MQIDVTDWFKFNYLTSLYLLIISTRFILIVDTTKQVTSVPGDQMCTKIQSMLSYGKYQTSQMSSNITYVSRVYAQNFLAYSPLDDILVFIEPKHQLHVYNAQTVRLIVNVTTTNVVYATSCPSLTTADRHDLFFVYESRLTFNRVSIRICEIRFDRVNFNFEEKKCVDTLRIRCKAPEIRINGFTIKRDHAGTKKSLLFVSTDIGLVYTIFDTNTGSLIRQPIVLNDTLNEGNVVVTSSGIIYYANKQEHTIHEIHITRDFRIRYGKIIKSNAIKSPFGLITDECNHLYIATKSMILVMFIQTYTTIRSVFSKASDLPISIERINSTTYVYATVKKYSGKVPAIWMFNFLSFADSEKLFTTTRPSVVNMKKKLDFNNNQTSTTNISESLSTSESPTLMTTDTTETSTQFSSLPTLRTLLTEHSTSILSTESINYATTSSEPVTSDDYLQSSSSASTFSKDVTSTINPFESTAPSVQTISDDYTTSIEKTTLSTDVPDRYSPFSTSSSQETDEEMSTFSSSLSTTDSTEHVYSPTSTSTSLETTSSSQEPSTVFSTPNNVESTEILSTILVENTTPFSIVHNEDTTVPSFTTDIQSISSDQTLRTTSEYLSDSDMPHFSTSNSALLSTSQTNDVIISTDLSSESPMATDSLINTMHTSTSSMTVTDFINTETDDEINQSHSSPMLVEIDVSSTVHSSSPSILSSTTLLPSPSSQLSSPLSHSSLAHSSTISSTLNRLLSSKHFSVTTTMSTPPTTLSSSMTTLQTTDLATTSDITEQSSMMTSSEEPSSPLETSYLDDTSSSAYETSLELSTTDDATSSTTIVSSTIFDSTTTVQPDESSTFLLHTTSNAETLTTTDSTPFETITASTITDEHSSEYTSIQSSIEITSTILPNIYTTKTEHSTVVVTQTKPRSNRPTRRKTSESTTSSTTTSTTTTSTITTTTTTTTTTTDSYRTRKQKVTRLESSSSAAATTTMASTASVQITSISDQFSTSSPIPIWYSKLTSLQQEQIVVIRPLLNTNSSNTLLSNELLNTLFNHTTNSSNEKFIFVNLADLPPSSWNVSLHTNGSILLDIILPMATYPASLNTTTNLTITNVDANRFATSINGVPINLQVHQIHAKQFSLAMNLTNDQTNQSLSDVVIGHIKSEQFELNITKSDNMNLHVQQVDADTAELFFDSKFCTNESNLQINLNLAKNGTIRYGDRAPLRIGSVFTRVHMLKQSCHLDQPFTLFFDICEGQNPCLNGGTCKSETPNYDDPSFSPQESSPINYHCICPVHISGENCQDLQYPFGYCINGGTLITTVDDVNNQSAETCLCAQGFRGQHCEENIDDCINIRCSNHGVCQDGINTYTCACFDGFYGNECEKKNVETVLLQVASKSFATVAIFLIASIAGLFVASDIHTYLTRKKPKTSPRSNKLLRATSELFENSVLLLNFGDAPIELSDLSTVDRSRTSTTTTTAVKQRQKKMRKKVAYQKLAERRYTKTLEKPSSKRSLFSNPSYETIL